MFRLVKTLSIVLLILCVAHKGGAHGLTCRALFEESSVTPYRVTKKDLKNAFAEIDKAFVERLSKNPFAESDLSEPYNAFFLPEGGFEPGVTWRTPFKELKLSREQLNESWSRPLYLRPTEVVLYRGHLFPSAYFVRRTSLGGLNRAIPENFSSFGEQLPYARVRGSSVEVHETGGSRKLFELWLSSQNNQSELVTLYRSCSKAEYQQQIFVRNMMRKDLDQPVATSEIEALRKISSSIKDEDNYQNKQNLDRITQDFQTGTRRALVAELMRSIGYSSGGVFTSLDFWGAEGFQRENDVIVHYQIPRATLQQLVTGHEVYFGIEFDYFELAFIDEAQNQNAKTVLFNSILGISN